MGDHMIALNDHNPSATAFGSWSQEYLCDIRMDTSTTGKPLLMYEVSTGCERDASMSIAVREVLFLCNEMRQTRQPYQ
jgi:hypothetical protein